MGTFCRILSRLYWPVPFLSLTATLAVAPPAHGQQGRVLEGRSFRSEALDMEWEYSVYLPSGYESDDRSYLTVFLLHGYGGNHTDWVRQGDASMTADSLIDSGAIPPVILIMPDGRNSFYVDSDGESSFGAYESAIVEDLISHVDSTYRTIATRRGRMIAGLSMGGYGATHLAFKYPHLFGAAATLSGVVASSSPSPDALGYFPAFGDPFQSERWDEENPHSWIPHLKEAGVSLPVYLTVGDDDGAWFYEGAVELYTALKEAELQAELRITDGDHSWGVWDRSLAQTLVFFSRVFRARYR